MATAIVVLVIVLAMGLSFAESPFFFTLFLLMAGYLVLGRFYHDALLRRRVRYELSEHGLAVWLDGRDAPECVFTLFQLRNVTPLWVLSSGRGTIELPPGGWAAEPEWFNRWDKDVPAMYPCRRLELIDDVQSVADMIRSEARRAIN